MRGQPWGAQLLNLSSNCEWVWTTRHASSQRLEAVSQQFSLPSERVRPRWLVPSVDAEILSPRLAQPQGCCSIMDGCECGHYHYSCVCQRSRIPNPVWSVMNRGLVCVCVWLCRPPPPPRRERAVRLSLLTSLRSLNNGSYVDHDW